MNELGKRKRAAQQPPFNVNPQTHNWPEWPMHYKSKYLFFTGQTVAAFSIKYFTIQAKSHSHIIF